MLAMGTIDEPADQFSLVNDVAATGGAGGFYFIGLRIHGNNLGPESCPGQQ